MSITWESVGHFFASGIHDLAVALGVVEKASEKFINDPAAQAIINAIATAAAGAQGLAIARTGESVLGMAIAAYHAADPAVRDKGLDLHLDAQAVAALLPIYKALNPHAPQTQATIAAITAQMSPPAP